MGGTRLLRWASAVIGLMLYLFIAMPADAGDDAVATTTNDLHVGYGPLSARIQSAYQSLRSLPADSILRPEVTVTACSTSRPSTVKSPTHTE
jgi:hypothetical protein